MPFDDDQIVEILRGCEPAAADDHQHEDHTTFWLVLADQFHKHGVVHAPTRDKAIGIIDQAAVMEMEAVGPLPIDLEKARADVSLVARLGATV